MDLEEAANLGEILGGLAILVTLLFGIRQIVELNKAKERVKHGFVQVCKGNQLARLADEMEVSSELLPLLTQGSENLSGVLDSSSYMFN